MDLAFQSAKWARDWYFKGLFRIGLKWRRLFKLEPWRKSVVPCTWRREITALILYFLKDRLSFTRRLIINANVSAELTWLPKTSSLFVLFCCYFCLWLRNVVISTNLVGHFNQGKQYFITGALLARIFGRRWMPWIALSWSGISMVWPVYYYLRTWPSPWMSNWILDLTYE